MFACETGSYGIVMLFDNAKDAAEWMRLQSTAHYAKKDGYGGEAKYTLFIPGQKDFPSMRGIDPIAREQLVDVGIYHEDNTKTQNESNQ